MTNHSNQKTAPSGSIPTVATTAPSSFTTSSTQPVGADSRRRQSRRRPSLERTPNHLLWGSLLVLVGGTIWGVNGSVAKILLSDYHVSAVWFACIRQFSAGIIFLAVSAIVSRRQLIGAVKNVRSYPLYIFTALVCVTLEQIAYFYVIQYTNAGTATVLQTVNLIMVLAYVCFAAHRWPHLRESIGIIMAFAGVFLLATGGNVSSLSMPVPALVWGLLSAFSAACLAIVPLKLIARWGDMVVNGIAFFISGVILMPFVRPWEHVPALGTRGWLLLLFSIVVGTFVAFWFYMAGMSIVGSLRGSLLATIEPIVATITAVAWNGAVFTVADWIGIALIILMVFVIRRQPEPATNLESSAAH